MAENTSQKHRTFIATRLGDKPVTDVAGIGPVIGGELKEAGFEYAYNLLGQFLLLNKSVEDFKTWMKDTAKSSNEKHRSDCAECLSKFCELML